MTVAPWIASRNADIVARAREWLGSLALGTLVDAFGCPKDAPPSDLLRWSAAAFDTRRGAERRDATPIAWDAARVDALLAAALPLGLRETPGPQCPKYDTTVLLGGATTGNKLRTAFAARLAQDGTDLGLVIALTAERPISGRERRTDPDSLGSGLEWEHLLRCVDQQFGPLNATPVSEDWRDQSFTATDGRAIRLLVAPPSTPRRRATTTDAIRFLLERVDPSRALVVTSAIYAPYQYFLAGPMLLAGRARHLEVVGTPTATDGDRRLLAQRLAQETHAAITAATAVLETP